MKLKCPAWWPLAWSSTLDGVVSYSLRRAEEMADELSQARASEAREREQLRETCEQEKRDLRNQHAAALDTERKAIQDYLSRRSTVQMEPESHTRRYTVTTVVDEEVLYRVRIGHLDDCRWLCEHIARRVQRELERGFIPLIVAGPGVCR